MGKPVSARTTARITSAVASGSCANISERRCRFGQLTLTSRAISSSRAPVNMAAPRA